MPEVMMMQYPYSYKEIAYLINEVGVLGAEVLLRMAIVHKIHPFLLLCRRTHNEK